ncbi:MAG: esterase-like activity of phytase family protein [Methylohalobius sp.]|nr:esterase-like activity of phytase family protein [Methylohalobius sp.]
MTLRTMPFCRGWAALLSCLTASCVYALDFELIGTYNTGLAQVGQITSGETAALRGEKLYVTNAEDVSLDIVDVSDPSRPTLQRRVSLAEYGSSATSVAVSSRNLIAVAVAAHRKTDPGTVVFLTPSGQVVRTVRVGALPDMVTFTPNGRKLLVANEGEPSCYGAGCVDPEGSVSIIDVIPLRPNLPVTTARFSGVLIPPDVRLFGPGATPEQDLEPEYITVTPDSRVAYVTLQENNAIAVIDIDAAKVKEIRALGYKNFNIAATTSTHELRNLPNIGVTAAGQTLFLGGFSGLFYEGKTADGKLKFVTHTDRGPNGEPINGQRPFLLPQFTPELVRLELDPRTDEIAITERMPLKRSDGHPLTGLPNVAVPGGNPNTPYNDEVPIDLYGVALPLDPYGADLEGIAVDANGHFWMADEYRPALYHFDSRGYLIERFVPIGTAAAAGASPEAYGTEVLPAVLGQRRQNRGFEAIAWQNGKLYAFVQSPLRNPAALSNSALNALRNIRVIEFDPITRATRQFLYVMDNPAPLTASDTRADKIGDATAIPGGGFLVIERDDDALPDDPLNQITKRVYAFNLTGATDITFKDTLYNIGGVLKSLDQMTPAELASVGVTPLAKVLRVDLAAAGYNQVEKIEGLAWIDAETLAVINDNDFGVAGIAIDQATGTFSLIPGYEPEPVLLGIVKTTGLDASDRDNVINIRPWPIYGMYQPDAVDHFVVAGRSYLITANEGDARDYPGLNEEVRARDVRNSYPSEIRPTLSDNLQLGRLTVTRHPPLGDMSQPYMFGTRSFSIWDAQSGAQIYDSGSELEVRTAALVPKNFNGNNTANTFDDRSDNKGPEPEGVAVGAVGDQLYAFIGLERVGGVLVYDLSDLKAPRFVTYLNTRRYDTAQVGPDSGPEIVRFIGAKDSPLHTPLLLVANEITGTVNLWRIIP